MICNFCWLLWIWFAGALVTENEPAAGGSSLSRFQPPLPSQATLSGHMNDFLPPGFVLCFCRKELWLFWKDFLLDFKESLVLDNSWWCPATYCWLPWKTACMDAENSDVLGSLGTTRKNEAYTYSVSLFGTARVSWITCDDQNYLCRPLKQDYKALKYSLWSEPINCSA